MSRPAVNRHRVSALAPLVLIGGSALVLLAWLRPSLHALQHPFWFAIGVFAAWRYGWLLLNYARAAAYSLWHYPRLRRIAAQRALHAPAPQRVFVVVASYLEEPWVSAEAFEALLDNLDELPCPATVIAAVGSDADEAVIARIAALHPARDRIDLVFQRQSEGKRIALGHALRAVARRHRDDAASITVLMDGDSKLEPGALARCLPFFAAYGDLGAVTTNERAFMPGHSRWLADWFALKFAQRHLLFQSHSLSHKVLTLTGRFSVFRTAILVREDFISTIENDTLTHWMHGSFRFLMGDDKSSWFYLLSRGWKMLYLPDVTCWCLESRDPGFIAASISLPYRWSGNALRNNPRALALGPRRTGWFIWWVILDQRLSMWTSLAGLAGALGLAAFKSVLYLPLYLAWAALVRAVQCAMLAVHGHGVTMRTVPLMLYTQWVGALVRIHAWFHLSEQRWEKGGRHQHGDAVPRSAWQRFVPKAAMTLSYAAFAVLVLLAHSLLRLPDATLLAAESGPVGIDVTQQGVRANDGVDDAAPLQALLDRVSGHGPVTLLLPPGELDFRTPLVIRASDVTLAGAGRTRTRIVSHLRAPAAAVITVQGERGHVVARLSSALREDDVALRLDRSPRVSPGDFLWLREPNDDALLRRLRASRDGWHREQPFLRQSMLEVTQADGSGVRTSTPTGMPFDAGATEVLLARPVRNARLAGFTLVQRVEGRRIEDVRFAYDNAVPEAMLDGIVFDWTAHAVVEDVAIEAAGRNPIVFGHSYGFALRDCEIRDAWNKGDGGSGYLRITRSFRGVVERCDVSGIRHIALQWSAAFNRLADIRSGVDINFHGGYSHHNTAERIAWAIPPQHRWGPVTTTPPGAHWAPPDGPGNEVTGPLAAYTAPMAREASPAR